MHIRDKILLWISLPILWALLFYITPKSGGVIVNGILALIFLIGFIVLIVNIFVQIHKIDKSAKKDIKVKKQTEQGTEILKKKSFWIFFIIFIALIYAFRFMFKYFEINIYFQILLGIIYLIIAFFVYKKIREN